MAQLFASDPIYHQSFDSIDAERGVIKGVKVCSEGEARGHGIYLNKKFIGDVVEKAKGFPQGIKARFGHPNMCSTALGTYLGRYRNYRVVREETEGFEDIEFGKPRKSGFRNHAVADLYLDQTAKSLPKLGNAWDYILNLANTSPDMFGNSIVWKPGPTEVLEWEDEETKEKKTRNDATILSLIATDLVDSPAATDGLFEQFSSDELALQVTQFLDEHPDVYQLAVDHPEIVETFLIKYRQYKHLKNDDMAEQGKLEKMFNDLREWIKDTFVEKPEEGEEASEPVIPEEVETRLKAMEEAITSGEKENEELSESISKKDKEIEAKEKEIGELNTKLTDLEKKVTKLEGDLTKLNGKSTSVGGREGMEDEENQLTPEQQALEADLKKLRKELSEVHPDNLN